MAIEYTAWRDGTILAVGSKAHCHGMIGADVVRYDRCIHLICWRITEEEVP